MVNLYDQPDTFPAKRLGITIPRQPVLQVNGSFALPERDNISHVNISYSNCSLTVAENMKSKDSPPGFSRIANRAKRMVNDHGAVQKVVEQASAKAKSEQKRLKGSMEDLAVLLRMLKAWATRRYTSIPLRSLTMALAAVLYFLLPLDFIPDFILGSGFLDDLAVIGFVIQSVKKDIDAFRLWETDSEDSDDADKA